MRAALISARLQVRPTTYLIVCIQPVEDFLHERWQHVHLSRLNAIRDRKNEMPGPREAKQIMRMIEKERLRAQERRLRVLLFLFVFGFKT